MKHTLITAVLVAAGCSVAFAAGDAGRWEVSEASLTRQGKLMAVDMTLSLTGADVASDRALLLTPMIVGDGDTLRLHSVGIYGRSRYYHYLRQGDGMLSGHNEVTIRSAERPETLAYDAIVPYEPWMDGASLQVSSTLYGCCSTALDAGNTGDLATYRELRMPSVIPAYVAAQAVGEKTDSLADRAYIAFVVNRTDINADYRDNHRELSRIRHSIDTVVGDPDFTLTGIHLKGYASPESPYAHNDELAAGRTQALRQYIMQLYRFPAHLITTDHQAEDWDGLREYVAASAIDHRDEILAMIDSDGDPDAREAAIKKKYPQQYAFLLEHAYPALRHTDYRVDYTIRRYTDLDEIARVFDNNPRKLSLDELYLLASRETPGSERWNDIYLTAARMYPGDEIANLNAANAALQRGSLTEAEAYLQKCGDRIEALYARGILLTMRGQYTEATPLLRQAADAGLEGATPMLDFATAKSETEN